MQAMNPQNARSDDVIIDLLSNGNSQANDEPRATPHAHPHSDRRHCMTEEQGVALTDLQRARLDYARLEAACIADLDQADPASLILIIEKLRLRLTDTIRLVDEITSPSTERHP